MKKVPLFGYLVSYNSHQNSITVDHYSDLDKWNTVKNHWGPKNDTGYIYYYAIPINYSKADSYRVVQMIHLLSDVFKLDVKILCVNLEKIDWEVPVIEFEEYEESGNN